MAKINKQTNNDFMSEKVRKLQRPTSLDNYSTLVDLSRSYNVINVIDMTMSKQLLSVSGSLISH